MAPLQRTLSNRLLKLPPFRPSWPRAAQFSATADGRAPVPLSSAAASPPYESSPPIDAGSSIRKPISLWPGMYFSPVTNALWEARSKMFEEVGGAGESGKAAPPPASELVPRSPARSRTSIFHKFSSVYIRMGKLVEDLDALAGTICYKHFCSDDGTTRPLLLVTASVDRMVLKRPIRIDADLQIEGAVTWVGRSSMEIQLEVTQSTEETQDSSDSVALTASFTFVARDSRTGKSAPVKPISPVTDREKLLWEEAEKRNKVREKKREERNKYGNIDDLSRLQALLAEGRVFCDMPALADRDSILIKRYLNIHGRIFEGFLMRRAFKLAFSSTYAFAGVAPRSVKVDHVDFLRPLDIPAEPLTDVEVVAHVMQSELRSSEGIYLFTPTFFWTQTIYHPLT
ncbi:hypothetical protein ACJRO7_000205 [Eucalyptus globulus]|uniref:HotDog ACOT-type domain-containing protein n=1 Tax=Eucalyptus globulus TaxID=34317 RepID=A0ABD3LN24_EUCGL